MLPKGEHWRRRKMAAAVVDHQGGRVNVKKATKRKRLAMIINQSMMILSR